MARSFNKVFLIGYAADEPIVRRFENGGKVANLTVVTNESIRRHESNDYFELTEWNRVVFWNQQAEVIERFIHKGSRLFVEGKLRTRSYTDKSGVKRYTTEIVSDNMIMLDTRNNAPDGIPHSPDLPGGMGDDSDTPFPTIYNSNAGANARRNYGNNAAYGNGSSYGNGSAYGRGQGGYGGQGSYGGQGGQGAYGGQDSYGGQGGYGSQSVYGGQGANGNPSFGGYPSQGGQGGNGFGNAPAAGNQPSYPNYQNPYGNMNSNAAPMSAGDMAAGAAMGAAMGAMSEAMGAAAPEPNPNTFSGVNGPISLDNAPAAGFGVGEAKPAASATPAAPAADAAAPSPAPVNDNSNDDDIPF